MTFHTKPREWPNNARFARDEAALAAQEAIQALKPLVRGERFTREEVIRREAIALSALYDIAQALACAGAQIKNT